MNGVWLMLWAALLVPPAPKRHRVVMQNFQFKPTIVHGSVGDTIVWENRDIVPHTADANDKTWASGHIGGHAQRITVIKRKGEQAFTCLYHSNMKGKLVVK
jgi:plastocyanin